jgi:beta-N-acetylhexosaminidase
VRALNDQLRALPCGPARPGGPLVGVDQEWGPVNRLAGLFPALPPAAELGCGDAGEGAAEAGAITGRLLHALGFHLDFAPVLDLCEPGAANGIGERSFGTDPDAVTDRAGAFLDGLVSAGVSGTIKHFPGLGRTVVDSHTVLPEVHADVETLRGSDLVPFRRLVAEKPGVPVMVGHGWYPALEPGSEPVPASLSPAVIEGLLRGELGHRGVVITDDLEMGAVTGETAGGSDPFDDAVGIRALLAGVDWILICHRRERILAAKAELDRELRGSPVLRRIAGASLERIRGLARQLDRRRLAQAHRPDDGPAAIAREMSAFLEGRRST